MSRQYDNHSYYHGHEQEGYQQVVNEQHSYQPPHPQISSHQPIPGQQNPNQQQVSYNCAYPGNLYSEQMQSSLPPYQHQQQQNQYPNAPFVPNRHYAPITTTDSYSSGGTSTNQGYEQPSYSYNRQSPAQSSYNSGRNQSYQQQDDDFETQMDTIFVQNLPLSCTREQVAEAFGAIGVVKIDKKTRTPRVWIYKDKNTGEGKGEATVTYDDPESASAAIRWFDQKQILGKMVTVTLAVRKKNTSYKQRGGKRGKFGASGNTGRSGSGKSDYYGGTGGSSDNYSGPMRRSGGSNTGSSYRDRPY